MPAACSGLKSVNDNAVAGRRQRFAFAVPDHGVDVDAPVLDLATLAGPLLLIVVVNALATAAFAYFVTSRLMATTTTRP